MKTTHEDHKFSITIHSDDLAVINCLRALSKYSQKTGNNNIPWGGTKDKDWIRDEHQVTFHFSDPTYREGFLSELERLLPSGIWREIRRSDNDPAKPVK
ncbi:MAG: hypothetical protein PHU44_15530 [Syntrophales bacterium]|nr:hypothetical protein [Syntrophales bacterium]MDD5643518.1 hypothetical protein [Syntrophales bacterium]